MAIIWYHFGRGWSSGAHAILSQSQKPKLCRLYLGRCRCLYIAHSITQICSEQNCYLASTNQPTIVTVPLSTRPRKWRLSNFLLHDSLTWVSWISRLETTPWHLNSRNSYFSQTQRIRVVTFIFSAYPRVIEACLWWDNFHHRSTTFWTIYMWFLDVPGFQKGLIY